MPTLDIKGTEFTFSVLPLDKKSKGYWARLRIGLKNERISYEETVDTVSREELENLIFCLHRLLAGAYGTEYGLSYERAGFAVDLCPYTENGQEVSRKLRRENDCIVAFRFLMLSRDKTSFLNGVHTFMLHREDIEILAAKLREEFDAAFVRFGHGRGKYLFAGVSPLGYNGCNYWYFDKSKTVKAGDYVWVRMGRHNTEQIVYVDSVRYFNSDNAPFDPATVKQVLRKATEEEIDKIL